MFEVFIFTNGIFLAILLLIQRSELKRANIFLAFFLLSLSLELAPDLFEEEQLPLPETSFFTVPLLFLYVQQVISGSIRKPHWLLLTPGLAVNLFILLMGAEEPDLLVVLIITIPFYLLNLYLLFSLYRQINHHQSQLKNQYASLETRTLQWIRGLVLIFLVFHFVWIADDTLLLLDVDFPVLALIAELLTLVSVFWVGYYGLAQKASQAETFKARNSTATDTKVDEKERMAFDKAQAQIAEHKLYLNQELTLHLLAQQLDVNEKKLSGWINQFTDSNFYQFINQYRIAEFKRQLQSPENKNYSLLGIAQNAGFRNKSTFYKVFKEQEGTTPSDYKKSFSEP